MLSTEDLERLITTKRREIEQEKTVLGLSPSNNNVEDNGTIVQIEKTQRVNRPRALSESNAFTQDGFSGDPKGKEEEISPDLERYIRRYVGLPAMLKAGEYSPNNPLIRGERSTGDVLLGLGEYERRRNTLRKIRQRQYKEYLDQQAKKKQEAKEQAERERKEREEKDRLREERERERLECERVNSPERRRASVSHSYVAGANNTYVTKVDTGVQVDHRSTPLSVAVQTDDETLLRLTPSNPVHNLLTQAERELSPHTVGDGKELCGSHQWDWKTWDKNHNHERRRSYGDCDERTTLLKKPRDRLSSELRHTYMPSIFDAEAIRLRNEQAEKEAAERRQFYQQELKNQIMEQQRIKEERKNREKMLEQAEMRRLEEQLRSLKMAQEREIDRHHDIKSAMKDNAADYERKRTTLQKEIDLEHQALLKAAIHPKRTTNTSKSESPKHTKLPFFYKFDKPSDQMYSQNYDVDYYLRRNLNPTNESLRSNRLENNNIETKQVPEISKELRYLSGTIERTRERDTNNFTGNTEERNGNVNKFPERLYEYKEMRKLPENQNKTYGYPKELKLTENLESIHRELPENQNKTYPKELKLTENIASVHRELKNVPDNIQRLQENVKERKLSDKVRLQSNKERNTIDNRDYKIDETLPIPILRHTPPRISFEERTSELSEKMQIVDDKWKVPAVQKNILKSLPNEKGKNVSILTQLGSIRKQLQLEQLKLDKMLSKNHN